MNERDLEFLKSPAGQKWLAELAEQPINDATHIQWASRLRRDLTQTETHAILETTVLRQRAKAKFSRADRMYFTRRGLEMSSAEAISYYRAERFKPFARVVDMGCGIGGDALGLAASGARVSAIDINPAHAAMTQHNLTVYGFSMRTETQVGNLMAMPPQRSDALFFDPARRDIRGKRIHSVHDYQPPLSMLDRWRKTTPHAAAKISPGVAYNELPVDAEVEFVSVDGDVREAVLWFGDLRTGVARRATVLSSENYAATIHGSLTTTGNVPVVDVGTVRPYLYEPDGAVIRAHLVEHLAMGLNASKLDPAIAYITGDEPCETPFATRYRVLDTLPFQLKRLRAYLRERKIGRITIKKRGSALDPDQLRKQLKLKGEEEGLIFLTRVEGEPMVIVAERDQ